MKRTKLFALLNQDGGLRRIKIGRKTLVTMESIRALIEQGGR
ncbi:MULTISPECIES: excisionase [unclassified Novosphingobium]|nr:MULTISPECIES: excisionase [unclassified Novosphingobium]HQV04352.1 excisionase [Novosphingobium sp.]